MQGVAPAILLLWLAIPTTSLAGLSALRSSAHLSAGGKRLLVMVSPDTHENQATPTRIVLPDGRSITVHETFSQSGVYDSATPAPVWQVDWYSLEDDLRWSGDFADVVRLNRFGLDPRYPPGAAWALAFYHEGHLAKRYDCEHLLTGLKNPQFFELKTWDWYSKWFDTFEVKGSHLVLSTARRRLGLPTGHMLDLGLQEFYTFDLPTGIIVSRSATGGGLIWWYTLIVTFVLLAIFIGWWLSRRYRSNELAG